MTLYDRSTLASVLAAILVTTANFSFAEEFDYKTLSSKYSTTAPDGFVDAMKRDYKEDSPNSCAIRLAFALEAVKSDFFDDFESKAVFDKKPIRARELAEYLSKRVPGGISISTGDDGRKAIGGKKGIIYFANIRPRQGQTGVSWHISLWDSKSVVDKGDYFDRAKSIQFWPLD